MKKIKHADVALVAIAYGAGIVVTILVLAVLFGKKPAFMASHAAEINSKSPVVCLPKRGQTDCGTTQKLAITSPRVLPDGKIGKAYAYTFAAVGGTAPYTWEVDSAATADWYPCCSVALLPNGQFTSISGTPLSIAGTFQVGVKVTDAAGQSTTSLHAYTINPENVGGRLVITGSDTLPSGRVGESYYHQLTFTGGVGPYAWKFSKELQPNPTYPALDCMRLSRTGAFAGCLLAPSMPYSGTYKIRAALSDRTQTVERTFLFTIVPSRLNPEQ